MLKGNKCRTAWKIVGKDRWDGDFNSKTANPILWGSMESDYITPLNQARNMSDLFPGSRLLIMKGGYGHSTLAMPSRCATKVIPSHFLGKLAEGEDEIVCHPDRKPMRSRGQDERGSVAYSRRRGRDSSTWTRLVLSLDWSSCSEDEAAQVGKRLSKHLLMLVEGIRCRQALLYCLYVISIVVLCLCPY